MPSPVGHTLFGLGLYILWCKNILICFKRWMLTLWVIVCANLPDFDLFAGLFTGELSRYHQGYTHTLGFALFVGLVVFGILKIIKIKDVLSISLLSFVLVFFHVLMDSCNFDSRFPIGVMLFWPFSNHYFNPIQIFYPVPHSEPGDVFSAVFMDAVGRELILLFIPFVIIIFFKVRKNYGKN